MGERGKPDQLTLLCFLAIMQKQEVAPGSRRKEKVAPGAFCGSPHYRQLILASIISHVWMGGGWGSHNHHYRSAQRGIDAWNAELSDSFRRFNGANTTGTALHNLLVFVWVWRCAKGMCMVIWSYAGLLSKKNLADSCRSPLQLKASLSILHHFILPGSSLMFKLPRSWNAIQAAVGLDRDCADGPATRAASVIDSETAGIATNYSKTS